LKSDPTGYGDGDYLIIGDLNSYAMEDPIQALVERDYTNLLLEYIGPTAYTYIFDGGSGYLDNALASPTMAWQIAGVQVWHINADEPSVIDYNTEYKSQDFYTSDPFRASDHDPIIIDLDIKEIYSYYFPLISVNP
jgi:predicted extracellular nuclease